MKIQVEIVGAPGFMNFQAQAMPGLHRYRINDDCPLVSVVADFQGELFVIPSEFVFDVTEEESQR